MRRTIMGIEAAQLRLLTWFSPAFPVGAFGYSHGLETAIREGQVGTADALEAWILGLLEHGSGWSDAVLFRLAWAADAAAIAELGELAEALAPSLERHRETMHLGAAFLKAAKPWLESPSPSTGEGLGWGCVTDQTEMETVGAVRRPPRRRPAAIPYPSLSPIEGERGAAEIPRPSDRAPYPIVAGAACAAAGIPLAAALTAWLHGFAANLVSVAVRAVPIGQSDAVRTLAALEPAILAVAERAAVATRDDLGACAFLSDIAAMRHETLQPRLFIS